MCQWALVIELFEFDNPMNWEIREISPGTIEYCCCDSENTCSPDRSAVSLTQCTNNCDTFFIVELLECEGQQQCFISTIAGTLQDSYSHSSFGYIFTFNINNISSEVNGTVNKLLSTNDAIKLIHEWYMSST